MKILPKIVLCILAVFSLQTLVCAALPKTKKTNRPNILIFIADDMCPDAACDGDPLVKTPNIDRLASEGIRYTNAYATNPVCSPARSSLITGMYPTSINCQEHRTLNAFKKPLPGNVKPITELLHSAGYYTINGTTNMRRPGKQDYNFITPPDIFQGKDWHDAPAGHPFFAMIEDHNPHREFHAFSAHPVDPDKVKLPAYYGDTPLERRDYANYLEAVETVDYDLGQVLQDLKKSGKADNTIVIFTSDQGRAMFRDKQWLYDGGLHIPLIIRWPGHLKPGTVRDQMVSQIDISATALEAARIPIPKWMQGRPLLGTHAKVRDAIFASRDRCDGTVDRIRCVRTKRFKYIHNYMPNRSYAQFNSYKKEDYPDLTELAVLNEQGKADAAQALFFAKKRSSEELYDLQKDPDEVHNLANDPAYKTTLVDLRNRVNAWLKKDGDDGAKPENPKSIAINKKNMHYEWLHFSKAHGTSPDISDIDYLKWWKDAVLNPNSRNRRFAARSFEPKK